MRKQRLALATSNEQPSIASSRHDTLVIAASQIVSAYIVNRPAEKFDLPALTAEVYATLAQLSQGSSAAITQRAPQVPVDESVRPDYLVCLEDGKQVKMLKRYLRSNYNMTPEEYRMRWNLPANYPMVAPNYAKVRSALAKKIGLGRRAVPHGRRLKVGPAAR